MDSLTAVAREAGYLHGLLVGAGLGVLLGLATALFLVALLRAAGEEPPDPAPVRRTHNGRTPRLVR